MHARLIKKKEEEEEKKKKKKKSAKSTVIYELTKKGLLIVLFLSKTKTTMEVPAYKWNWILLVVTLLTVQSATSK